MKLETIINISEHEKQLLQFSLPVINANMDILASRFYFYLLKTKAGSLFNSTKIENQHKMFSSSFNVFITHLLSPHLLHDNLDKIINNHIHYGVLTEHVDCFIESFTRALADVLKSENNKKTLHLWTKIISEIMYYFKEPLLYKC